MGRFSEKIKGKLTRGSGSDVLKGAGAEQQSETLSIRAALSHKFHGRGHITHETLEKQSSIGHSGDTENQHTHFVEELKTKSLWEEAQQKVLQNQDLTDIFDVYEKELLEGNIDF
ncbi:hypothetical protein N7540_003289 [Penicillium herquei]|nr:hypothetical protein N7540_003289 [Penicillium herquei]